MKRSRSSWLLVGLIGAGGCVTTAESLPAPTALAPAASRPSPTPAGPAMQPAALPSTLAAPPLPPVALTLDQVVHATLANDPRLRAALEGVNQAIGDHVTATLPPNPELMVDRQLMPLTRPFTLERPGGPTQTDAGVSWRIDWFLFGKRAAEMATRAQGIKAAQSDYADTVRQRVADVTQAFYAVLEARELLRVARQDVENLELVEAVLVKAVAAGGRPAVELSRIRLDLLNSRRTQREAEAAVATARASLQAFLGQTHATSLIDVAGSLDATPTGEVLPADASFAVAEQGRPDIQALRDRVAQADADVLNQHRRAFPEVTPNLWYTRQYQVKSMGVPNADSWNAALSVTLPFFDRNQGNRIRAASESARSRYELQAALVALRAEIETVLQELHAARANAELLTGEQLKLAAEVRDTITRAYKAGGRTLLETLDANRTYNETYRAAISTRANFWRALYRYYAVIGRQVTVQETRLAPPKKLPVVVPAP